MQVGIGNPFESPALAVTTTPDGTYRYTLLEFDTVTVEKRRPDGDWEPTYLVSMGACDCIGYQNRDDCKHADVARGLMRWWAARA